MEFNWKNGQLIISDNLNRYLAVKNIRSTFVMIFNELSNTSNTLFVEKRKEYFSFPRSRDMVGVSRAPIK